MRKQPSWFFFGNSSGGGFFMGKNMNWLNIEIKTLTSPEFLGSDPIDRGTWLCLMRFCAIQENGGFIEGCQSWKDRKFQQLMGITKTEAESICELWEWQDDGILVWSYPKDKETEVKANRKNGAKGGRPRKKTHPVPGSTTQGKPFDNEDQKPGGLPINNQVVLNGQNGKEKEGNGKERNNNYDAPAKPEGMELTNLIEDIYLCYPKQSQKVKALHSIARAITKELIDPQELQKKVRQYCIAIQWQDKRFIPDCYKWIDDQRWLDDPETWEEKKPGKDLDDENNQILNNLKERGAI
jgi:hypothetical protein